MAANDRRAGLGGEMEAIAPDVEGAAADDHVVDRMSQAVLPAQGDAMIPAPEREKALAMPAARIVDDEAGAAVAYVVRLAAAQRTAIKDHRVIALLLPAEPIVLADFGNAAEQLGVGDSDKAVSGPVADRLTDVAAHGDRDDGDVVATVGCAVEPNAVAGRARARMLEIAVANPYPGEAMRVRRKNAVAASPVVDAMHEHIGAAIAEKQKSTL